MQGIRHEDYHNTHEQVVEYLERALLIVDELDPPGDLRQAVFQSAINLVSSKQITVEHVGVGVPTMAIPRGKP